MEFEIIHKDRVISTNESLLMMAEQTDTMEGTVIIADEQSRGRGHGKSSWESEKGSNLTFSL